MSTPCHCILSCVMCIPHIECSCWLPGLHYFTNLGYISDTKEIIKPSCSLFQHDGAAAFKLSERSRLPPALSANDLPGERTQILNVHQIREIHHHQVETDEDSAPESISDTENWLNWNNNLHYPNDNEDYCVADDESDKVQINVIENPECQVQQDESTMANVPGLVRPIHKI